VDAHYNGFNIRTDQSVRGGGQGSAPPPFDLFLASIATCAGIYVKGFCDTRGIATDDMTIEMAIEPDSTGRRVGRLQLDIHLPAGFPVQYRDAVLRSAELCAVKQHLHEPPLIEVRAVAAS
jgi:ribosomal protein S12 methylthiotransferase accessory factor